MTRILRPAKHVLYEDLGGEIVDECLVPYDFHWTQDSAITDDGSPRGERLFALYCRTLG